jgi:molybdate transport system substrate-binding protein
VRRAALSVAAALVAGVFALPAAAAEDDPETITVFAAVSLTDVLQEIGAAFRADAGVAVRFSFAASSALARQVESGASAHAFVSADAEWMDDLTARGLVDAGTRRDVAGNELVLIAPADSPVELTIAPGLALTEALGGGRLAVAEPETEPAGRYARAALTTLGAWEAVRSRLAPAENVRAALALVARGEAPLGVVYRTDARVEPRVRVVDSFPAGTYPPIAYPAAALAGAPEAAAEFVEYLASEKAQDAFRRNGFTAPP